MPTYEYECKSCSHHFEVFQSMSDPSLKECPKCGKEIRRLIFGGTGVIFKGSGFYVTDKGKASKPVSRKAESGASACAQCPASGGEVSGDGGENVKCPAAAQTGISETKSGAAPAVCDGSSSGKAKPESKSA